ncbi:uncharacterized protein PG986_002725, partial [Apiospora aurea]
MKLWRKYEFRVKTFQEGAGLTAVNIGILNEKVVPDASSKLDDPLEEAETLQGNHRDIVRFISAHEPNYVAVIGELYLSYGNICIPIRNVTNNSILSTPGMLDIIQSLAFDQMRHREDSVNLPQRGTCVWLRSHPCFQSWLRSFHSNGIPGLLWIEGKPGSGKSTLMRATMQDSCFKGCI